MCFYGGIQNRVDKDSSVQGANLIILIAAIFIASVGLNMNSTAVIIGAMLVSPLMGGIIAVGYGMATYNMYYVRRSLKKLFFQILFSVITATIYFTLSPITTPSDEILARVEPTIWDVLIALFGGIAGAVGNTRAEKTNVIPGVAIATALMPPLCTAGYGIARGSLEYFGGALYLFFINSFFIAVSSVIIFKLIHVPIYQAATKEIFIRQRSILWILGFVVTIPSIYMAYQSVEANMAESQVKTFIQQEVQTDTRNVVSYQISKDTLVLDIVGTPLTKDQINKLVASLHNFNKLQNKELHVVQNTAPDILSKDDVQQLINSRISKSLIVESLRSDRDKKLLASIKHEASIMFPAIKDIQGGSMIILDDKNQPSYSTFMANVYVSEQLSATDAAKLQDWLKKQINMPMLLDIRLVSQTNGAPTGNGIQ